MRQLIQTFGTAVCIIILSITLAILRNDMISAQEWIVAVGFMLTSGIILFILVLMLANQMLQTGSAKPPAATKAEKPAPQRAFHSNAAQTPHGRDGKYIRPREQESKIVTNCQRNLPLDFERRRTQTYGKNRKGLWVPPGLDRNQSEFKDITQPKR